MGCLFLPKSQQASEPCCKDHGIDACGANLFCEAFDGRTQATCYILGSRKDGEECHADAHCLSAACNLELKKCKATPLLACDPSVGCSSAIDGQNYACAGGKCQPTDGELGSACGTPADCKSGVCEQEQCVACTLDQHCPGGACSNGTCVGCTLDSQCSSGKCNSNQTCCKPDPNPCISGSWDCKVDDGCGNSVACPCSVGTCAADGTCTTVGTPCTPGVTNCGAQSCLFDKNTKAYFCGVQQFGPSNCKVDADCNTAGPSYDFNHCHFFGPYPACRPWCLTDAECYGSKCIVDYPAPSITPETPGYCG
jgi:hypothetical protein